MKTLMNPYALSLLGSALISSILGIFVWRLRNRASTSAFPMLMFSLSWWSLTYGLEVASTDIATMRFWLRLEYFGIAASPVLWLLFAVQYAGKGPWLTRRNVAAIFAFPLLMAVLSGTNEFHNLFYSSIGVDRSGPLPFLDLTPGPAYGLFLAYTYLCLIGGTLLLLWVWLHSSNVYKRQAGIILLGAIVPFVVNILYLAGVRPFGHLDLTPFAFTVTGIIISFGLFQYKLFDMMPLAQDVLLENLRDGIVVVDAAGRIVEMNSIALKQFEMHGPPIGKSVEEALKKYPEITSMFRSDGYEHKEWGQDFKTNCFFDVRLSPILDKRRRRVGGLLVLRDITMEKKAEDELRKGKERLEWLLHSMPQAIIVIESKTRTIIDLNPMASVLIGLPPDVIVGKRCHEFVCIHGEGECPIIDGEETIFHKETELLTGEGRRIPVLKTCISLEVEGEEWLIETLSDISEIKRAELEQLEKEKLQAIVETTGAVCHEMNQPLMAVTANCELCLMDLGEEDPLHAKILTIHDQALRMADITRKLTGITNYRVKQYLDGRILDIESASAKKASRSF